jgi:hypothetical protein
VISPRRALPRRTAKRGFRAAYGNAAWLELARRAKLRGHAPCQHHIPATARGADLASEIRVLTHIAKSGKTIHAVADQVEAIAQSGPAPDEPPTQQTIGIDQLATMITTMLAPIHVITGPFSTAKDHVGADPAAAIQPQPRRGSMAPPRLPGLRARARYLGSSIVAVLADTFAYRGSPRPLG